MNVSQNAPRPWTDTTTLFVRVHDVESAERPLVAQGILTLDLEDLLWQASTIRLEPPANLLGVLEQRCRPRATPSTPSTSRSSAASSPRRCFAPTAGCWRT
jgi:hypothetical protein